MFKVKVKQSFKIPILLIGFFISMLYSASSKAPVLAMVIWITHSIRRTAPWSRVRADKAGLFIRQPPAKNFFEMYLKGVQGLDKLNNQPA